MADTRFDEVQGPGRHGAAVHAAQHPGQDQRDHAVQPGRAHQRAEEALAVERALAGGDDYELLFTAAAQQRAQIRRVAAQTGLLLTRIGCIDAQTGLRLRHAGGGGNPLQGHGFDHFAV